MKLVRDAGGDRVIDLVTPWLTEAGHLDLVTPSFALHRWPWSIVEWHKALAPAGDTTCVFRDSAFADDVAKTNLAAILEQHGLVNVRSL